MTTRLFGLGASEASSAERSWSMLTSWLTDLLFGQQLLGGMLACKCQDVYSSEGLSQPHRCFPAAF